ncbi:MAG: 3-dehydroquinate synthase [Alloprevotella sp.]|nr:3-dehydroquinate synthase [Alloprevotella sp.]
MQEIIYSHDIQAEARRLSGCGYDRIFLITEETVARHCLPLLGDVPETENWMCITLPATDAHKDLDSLARAWQALQEGGASRHSLAVNLGGGMITDLGGFATATFKRGMDFVNIPTTLLAMVDAAVGGKTGINFNGLKNELGVFRDARQVVIDTQFLRTLDAHNLRSGYAEMLKHALLDSTDMWARHVGFDLDAPELGTLQQMVAESIRVKGHIVSKDPTEKGLRKALNLGHTIGHALETLALQQGHPALHGYFVAWGLVAELYLSCTQAGFPTERMRQTVQFIRRYYSNYNALPDCKEYGQILSLMRHDKKNSGGVISMTLLGDIGDCRIDCHPADGEILEALDFLREG